MKWMPAGCNWYLAVDSGNRATTSPQKAKKSLQGGKYRSVRSIDPRSNIFQMKHLVAELEIGGDTVKGDRPCTCAQKLKILT